VTVTGLGGVGKTRLAVAAAEALVQAYEGRVRLVRLVLGSDPARLVDMVAAALGTAPSSVAAGVAGRPTLVVLDGFERVLSATGELGDVLGRARELHALVTSRERLRVFGERELALGPLPPEAAAALFLDRVHDLAPSCPRIRWWSPRSAASSAVSRFLWSWPQLTSATSRSSSFVTGFAAT